MGTLLIAAVGVLFLLDAHGPIAGSWLLPVLLPVTVLGTQEVLRLARAGGLRPLAWAVYCGNILLVLSPFSSVLFGLLANYSENRLLWLDYLWVSSRLPFFALAVGVLLIFIGEMRRYEKPGGVLANIAAGVFGLVYVGVTLSLAAALRLDWGIGAVATWVISVKMGDIGAYTVGRLIGRHKMAPAVSPGKTIEGAIGALAFSCLGSWVCFNIVVLLARLLARFSWLGYEVDSNALAAASHPSLHGMPGGWLVFGLLMGSVGMLGDLAESLLKRDAGCKDSSDWMPGFGGVLDILDSLLLTAPVAWLCWSLGIVAF